MSHQNDSGRGFARKVSNPVISYRPSAGPVQNGCTITQLSGVILVYVPTRAFMNYSRILGTTVTSGSSAYGLLKRLGIPLNTSKKIVFVTRGHSVLLLVPKASPVGKTWLRQCMTKSHLQDLKRYLPS